MFFAGHDDIRSRTDTLYLPRPKKQRARRGTNVHFSAIYNTKIQGPATSRYKEAFPSLSDALNVFSEPIELQSVASRLTKDFYLPWRDRFSQATSQRPGALLSWLERWVDLASPKAVQASSP